MIELHIERTFFNNQTQEFFDVDKTFKFEHSLRAVAKWEAKYKKPFLVETPHTMPELMDYFESMAFEPSFKSVYLTEDQVLQLVKYMEEPQTATIVNFNNNSKSSAYVSSEVLYASMAMDGVPFEADRWHLSRLMALLGVIAVRSGAGDANKKTTAQIYEENRALNERRRRELGTKG